MKKVTVTLNVEFADDVRIGEKGEDVNYNDYIKTVLAKQLVGTKFGHNQGFAVLAVE